VLHGFLLLPPGAKRTGLCGRSQWAILRRLVAKWLLASAQGRNASTPLAPLQTAFANGSPCEVVAMGVQAQVDALHESTGWLLLQVYLKNAFNSIARTAILGALERL